MRINGKSRCANCFCEIKSDPCPNCGYSPKTAANGTDALPHRTKLMKKYLIGGIIGRGGFGITYLAFDIKNDKILAIKEYFPRNIAVREPKTLFIKPNGEKNIDIYNKGLNRFLKETELSSQFNGNPNIVNVFECFRENGSAYCVMEYLSGTILEKYIENHGAISVEQCAYLAEKIASALVAIHSAGIIHRDVAPDNIMLCPDGKVKLLDFGAARKPSEETSLTVMIKTGFTPSEQYSDGTKLTAKTDIYALGTTLFYALTAKKPKNVFARMEDDCEFSEKLWAVTASFKSVIEKAAAINSAERFESAAEFLNALSDTKIHGKQLTFSGEDVFLQNKMPPARNTYVPRTRYFLSGMLAGVLLCFAAFTCVHLLNDYRSESSQTPSSENSASIPTFPVTVEFGSFEGSFKDQYVGKISKNILRSFGGSVKITLDIETVPEFVNSAEVYLIYPVDSSGTNMISFCTVSDERRTADASGAVEIEKDAREFSLVLTNTGIEMLDGGFGFETYNVAIKSITLEGVSEEYDGFELQNGSIPNGAAADYTIHVNDRGNKTVSAELKQFYITNWGGNMTNYIPLSAFECFSGDIKLTFQIEYSPKSSSDSERYQMLYMQTLGALENHIFEFAKNIPVYDENGSLLVMRTDNLGFFPKLGCTEFSVILPKNIVRKICGGLGFTGDNMIIKNVVIEDA